VDPADGRKFRTYQYSKSKNYGVGPAVYDLKQESLIGSVFLKCDWNESDKPAADFINGMELRPGN
jgi:hypothetical protein